MELSNPLISEYTWANKPSVAPLGQIICVTDVGENGSLWRGNGTKWIRMSHITYYSLSGTVSLTGTTTETTLLTIPIKGGLMGLRGRLIEIAFFTMTNNANIKTFRAKIGGSTIATGTSSSLSSTGFNFWLLNRNNQSSQYNNNASSLAIDTSVDFDLVITGQLANAADTLTLSALTLEAL
jgi:hypothetical protein